MTHTKGPWEINKDIDFAYIINDVDGVEICRAPRSGLRGMRTLANARLIAAAPELKSQNAALLEALKRIAELSPDQWDTDYIVPLVQKISKEAIRKAKE